MPDPKELKPGDRVRFVSLPEEWKNLQVKVPEEDVAFMRTMVLRRWPSRICEIDEYGTPWIEARIRRKGNVEHHRWGIHERTGWRLVRKRI